MCRIRRRVIERALCCLLLGALVAAGEVAPVKAEGDSDAGGTAGSAFLAGNRNQPGVVVTASGLQYLILVAGTGPRPSATDRVTVHYRGTLVDGTEFDNSRDLGGPASFTLGEVIPGWAEALQLMPVGSTWRLFVPPELAYGEQGAGLMIKPNATLVFEVELLAIDR